MKIIIKLNNNIKRHNCVKMYSYVASCFVFVMRLQKSLNSVSTFSGEHFLSVDPCIGWLIDLQNNQAVFSLWLWAASVGWSVWSSIAAFDNGYCPQTSVCWFPSVESFGFPPKNTSCCSQTRFISLQCLYSQKHCQNVFF